MRTVPDASPSSTNSASSKDIQQQRTGGDRRAVESIELHATLTPHIFDETQHFFFVRDTSHFPTRPSSLRANSRTVAPSDINHSKGISTPKASASRA